MCHSGKIRRLPHVQISVLETASWSFQMSSGAHSGLTLMVWAPGGVGHACPGPWAAMALSGAGCTCSSLLLRPGQKLAGFLLLRWVWDHSIFLPMGCMSWCRAGRGHRGRTGEGSEPSLWTPFPAQTCTHLPVPLYLPGSFEGDPSASNMASFQAAAWLCPHTVGKIHVWPTSAWCAFEYSDLKPCQTAEVYLVKAQVWLRCLAPGPWSHVFLGGSCVVPPTASWEAWLPCGCVGGCSALGTLEVQTGKAEPMFLERELLCYMWGCPGTWPWQPRRSPHHISCGCRRNPPSLLKLTAGNRHRVKPAYCFWAPHLCQGLTHVPSLNFSDGETLLGSLYSVSVKWKKLTQACVWVAQSYPTLGNPMDCTRQAPLSMKSSRHGPCSRPLGGSNGASPASLGARVSQGTALHTGPWLAASLTVDVHTGNGMIGAGRWGSTAQKICQSHSRSCSFFLFFFVFKIWGRESSPLDSFGKLRSFSAPGSLFPWIKRE